MAEIVYPESLFTGLRLQLMLMRFETQDAESRTRTWHRRTCLASFPFCVP